MQDCMDQAYLCFNVAKQKLYGYLLGVIVKAFQTHVCENRQAQSVYMQCKVFGVFVYFDIVSTIFT